MSRVLLFLLLLAPGAASAGVIEGRVLLGEAPLAGVRVAAHAGLDFSAAPLALSEPTDAEGYYRLAVAPGSYALFMRDVQRGLFAFCGRNPLEVGEAGTWAGLQAVAMRSADDLPYDDATTGAIGGIVLHDGIPLEGAHVYLYLDADEALKGQGYRMSLPTGADGTFLFEGLPESSYFLVVRKRQGGGRVGPVEEGDHLGIYHGNPLPLPSGRQAQVVLATVRKAKESATGEDRPWSGPVVRGTVSDHAGRPVAGVHVFAYREKVVGHKRPVALSARTGSDGAFVLRLEEPGLYFIGARQHYGDSPAPGELYGLYDDTADHSLAVAADGAMPPISIVVEPINLF
jgi:hypothetical protein